LTYTKIFATFCIEKSAERSDMKTQETLSKKRTFLERAQQIKARRRQGKQISETHRRVAWYEKRLQRFAKIELGFSDKDIEKLSQEDLLVIDQMTMRHARKELFWGVTSGICAFALLKFPISLLLLGAFVFLMGTFFGKIF
jgi:hypothetical protein